MAGAWREPAASGVDGPARKRLRLARHSSASLAGPSSSRSTVPTATLSPSLGHRANAQTAGFQAFDLLRGLVALEAEEGLAGLDELAVVLEPADEDALVHVPAQPGNGDVDGHVSVLGARVHSATRSRIAWAIDCGVGNDGGFERGAVGRGRQGAVEPADRRVEIVETLVGEPGGDLGAEAARARTPRRRSAAGRSWRPIARMVSISSGETVRGSISSTEIPRAASSSQALSA